MLALQGNMTNGKLNAIDSTNPILIMSLPNEVDKFIKMLPDNKVCLVNLSVHRFIIVSLPEKLCVQ